MVNYDSPRCCKEEDVLSDISASNKGPDGKPDFLTYSRQEAATALSISVRQLDKYVSTGELAKVKLNRRVVFLPEDLKAFLKAKRVLNGVQQEVCRG